MHVPVQTTTTAPQLCISPRQSLSSNSHGSLRNIHNSIQLTSYVDGSLQQIIVHTLGPDSALGLEGPPSKRPRHRPEPIRGHQQSRLPPSTMQQTSQDSPSITVSPPVEGAIIADVDSVKSLVLSAAPSVTSDMDVTSAPLISVLVPVEPPALCVDSSCVLHPFYVHKLDSGPVRLMTIAIDHAFNYRVAVLRDGVRSAIRIGRSRKAETCFLTEVNISWRQQVTVMFQIVSTMMVEVPAFATLMRELKGESPNIQLYSEPWGHVAHCANQIVHEAM